MISEDMRAFDRILGFQRCQRKETGVHGLQVKTVQKQLLCIQGRRHKHLKKGLRNHCGGNRENRDRVSAAAQKVRKAMKEAEGRRKERRREKRRDTVLTKE